MYQPWSQGPSASMLALVEAHGDPALLAGAVRQAIREIDPALPLPRSITLTELLSNTLRSPRSRTTTAR